MLNMWHVHALIAKQIAVYYSKLVVLTIDMLLVGSSSKPCGGGYVGMVMGGFANHNTFASRFHFKINSQYTDFRKDMK
jgi:ABC-type Co2+ transport system permease subunit